MAVFPTFALGAGMVSEDRRVRAEYWAALQTEARRDVDLESGHHALVRPWLRRIGEALWPDEYLCDLPRGSR
jgi:hypothetical protein